MRVLRRRLLFTVLPVVLVLVLRAGGEPPATSIRFSGYLGQSEPGKPLDFIGVNGLAGTKRGCFFWYASKFYRLDAPEKIHMLFRQEGGCRQLLSDGADLWLGAPRWETPEAEPERYGVRAVCRPRCSAGAARVRPRAPGAFRLGKTVETRRHPGECGDRIRCRRQKCRKGPGSAGSRQLQCARVSAGERGAAGVDRVSRLPDLPIPGGWNTFRMGIAAPLVHDDSGGAALFGADTHLQQIPEDFRTNSTRPLTRRDDMFIFGVAPMPGGGYYVGSSQGILRYPEGAALPDARIGGFPGCRALAVNDDGVLLALSSAERGTVLPWMRAGSQIRRF